MDNKSNNYGFWFWKEQLTLVISTIALLVDYDLEEEEIDLIKEELRGTDDEKDHWGFYFLSGKKNKLTIYFAYDSEEGNDMIHICMQAAGDFLIQLETLNLIQAHLSE